MLAGRPGKLTAKERYDREAKLAALRPGLLLRVGIAEYHEDDETPFGFMAMGDLIVLLRFDAHEKFSGVYHDWLVMTHWGIINKSASYLATCCEEVA